MPSHLIHALNDYVAVQHREREIMRYVYVSKVPPFECIKPYFQLRTLAGHGVTCFRPHDHLWHHGLAMTCADINGQNFWGGNSYVRDKGYVAIDNVGRQQHEGWIAFDASGPPVRFAHRLAWITSKEQRWIEEERTITLADLSIDDSRYTIEVAMALTNVSGQVLEFGSPTTNGRPNAGYGGLYWRGPRDLEHRGTILAAGDLEGPTIMGQRSPWIAFQGRLDGSAAGVTMMMLDHPDNVRYPTPWFTRNEGLAGFAAAFSFHEVLPLEPGATLKLRYRVAVIDGLWPRDQIEAYAAAAWPA